MSFMKNLWGKVVGAAGVLGDLIPLIAKRLKVALEDKSVERIRGIIKEWREANARSEVFLTKLEAAIEDGELSGDEAGPLLLELEATIDEYEDVPSGKDD